MGFDEAKAVRILLEGGREDYVVYAKDNTVAYRIGDRFDFRGFVGVVSWRDGVLIDAYLNDGDIIADQKGLLPAVTGRVVDFTKTLSTENSILIAADQQVDAGLLAGRYVYVENGRQDNGAYRIEEAIPESGGYRLMLGNTTLITSYADNKDFDAGFRYNIQAGQSLRIPLSWGEDHRPVFTPLRVDRIAANRPARIQIQATSPLDLPLHYTAELLPRGAGFDPESQSIVWTPDSSQIGPQIFRIKADDGIRESFMTASILVYQGVGGGAEPGSGSPDQEGVKPPEKEDGENTGESGEESLEEDPEVSFSDLNGFEWAADAIRQLARRGIVQGTGAHRFSPAAALTRGDFAILISRAFAVDSSSADSGFADVAQNAYYREAVEAVRAAGIVNGVGGGRFAPDAPITRQDMMTILARAAQYVHCTLSPGGPELLAGFTDGAAVASYAREAVACLVANEIVVGTNGKLLPRGLTNRAEAAVILYRTLELWEKQRHA